MTADVTTRSLPAPAGAGEPAERAGRGADTGSGDGAGRGLRARLRAAVRRLGRGDATPARLRRVAAVLVLGCLVAGVVSLVSGTTRSQDVGEGGGRIGTLTSDAAQLYRSLADADAMATSGFVSGGIEPAQTRAAYDADIATAAERLVAAAAKLPTGDPATGAVATISKNLPVYTGLVEAGRMENRQGLPLGQSYLSSASSLMTSTMLPAVAQLRESQTRALRAAYAGGGGVPWAPLIVLVAAIAAVVDVSVRERRRTSRVLSPGLVVAAGALVVALLWWAVASLVAGLQVASADRHVAVASELDDATTAVLQARSNESLVLVARNAGNNADAGYTAQLDRVLAQGQGDGQGLLDRAAADADPATRQRIDDIRARAVAWRDAHVTLRKADDGGDYPAAVASATGRTPDGSGATFGPLNAALTDAVVAERAAFTASAGAADGALLGLAFGPAVLALVAAVGVLVGIGRRTGEYR